MKAAKREPEQVSDHRRRKLRRHSRAAAEGEDDVAMPSGLQDSDGDDNTGDARMGVSHGGSSSNQMSSQAATKGTRLRSMNPSNGLPQQDRRGRHEDAENGGGNDGEGAPDEQEENVPGTPTPGEEGDGGLRRDSQVQQHGMVAGPRVLPAAYVMRGMVFLCIHVLIGSTVTVASRTILHRLWTQNSSFQKLQAVCVVENKSMVAEGYGEIHNAANDTRRMHLPS